MSLIDIINPWGALGDARRRIDILIERNRELVGRNIELEGELSSVERDADRNLRGALSLEREVERLRKLVAAGHFRNPATGRLGRRGEVF